ncbi:MAG: ACP S-malonyltransferase [Lachnospiraceae bacterium]|nr:ACP S-malonyltransferase [Lachnospiraceae bacterium]
MGKIAFIFPGQGAQYPGMGEDFYAQYATAREVFEKAEAATNLNLRQICFEKNDRLDQTEYTQIAMLTTELAILRVIEEKGIKADYAGGLSLGEYGALAAARVMEEQDLFRMIRKRGIYMQNAYPVGGAMTAVLGLDAREVEAVLSLIEGEVSIANYNCPGQIVITGEAGAVEEAALRLKEAGARRCVPLKVSGPFHSPLLRDASDRLSEALREVKISDPVIPYVTNVDATFVTKKDRVKGLLERQVCGSVRWQQCVENLITEGVDTFIEIGPGKTLCSFLRKIDPEVMCINIEKVEDLEKLADL